MRKIFREEVDVSDRLIKNDVKKITWSRDGDR
jgi:hypothetical protein